MALPPPDDASTALVTGASAGIGREIARGLARRGHNVTLVARRAERLDQLAAELSDDHGIRAETIPADLSSREARAGVIDEIEHRGVTVEILVNNAGYGIYAPFSELGEERELAQLEVLVNAPVHFN